VALVTLLAGGIAFGVPAAATVAALRSASGGHAPPPSGDTADGGPVRSALEIPSPRPLGSIGGDALWASVRSRSAARADPSAGARRVGAVQSRTPEGTTTLVPVLKRVRDTRGRVWALVALPSLPNGLTGWVPRIALGGYGLARTRLVIDQRRLTATLYHGGRRVFRAPVGVGRSRWPTPDGRFIVRSRLTRYRSPFYGPVAFGTSARSRVLTDWPAGGFIGIHGTDRPDLVPGRVSHGCIRMRNADILRLARLMPVGTPVVIR
jgi:lipoprotein-anchoring transpeptidase ErfK/SrfK